ncbi:acyl-CoA thioesteras-like protein [Tothia fuscella]|uniref:Acyl-CoA thioesteras-like protein n=1 Tax=Tothia fuscella TaxID=1048955 RepID=A0A9P4NER9_9PEZI|nr:acyl-CoA thioesteras-like protein [Tothia fuscella]
MVPTPYYNEKGEVVPFAKLMKLEKIDENTFRSTVSAYGPTGGENGAYGGHVYAQSAWAAAQTVKEGFVIHNVTGWFVLGGMPKEHFVYKVHNIRDGGNYCTRSVTVTQIAERGTMFTCTCSFKRAETSPIDYQETVDIQNKYKVVLEGKGKFDHSDSPSQDSTWFQETYLPQHPNHFNPVGGLHLRKVTMAAYNNPRAPIDRRQLIFYSVRGAMPSPTTPNLHSNTKGPPFSREANLHAVAHLYASDRNSLFIIPNHLGTDKDWTRMASLSHTVIFHVNADKLFAPDEPGAIPANVVSTEMDGLESGDSRKRKWFMQETWTTRAAGGRGLHTSRLWDPDTGVHLATTMQDGLVRFKPDARL